MPHDWLFPQPTFLSSRTLVHGNYNRTYPTGTKPGNCPLLLYMQVLPYLWVPILHHRFSILEFWKPGVPYPSASNAEVQFAGSCVSFPGQYVPKPLLFIFYGRCMPFGRIRNLIYYHIILCSYQYDCRREWQEPATCYFKQIFRRGRSVKEVTPSILFVNNTYPPATTGTETDERG